MRYEKFGDRYVLRFESGEPFMEKLKQFLTDESVQFSFISGAGGVRQVSLRYWDAQTQKYKDQDFEEQLEMLSLSGDTSRLDGSPHVHAHALFGRSNFTVLGGHIKEAHVHPTLELWVSSEGIAVQRKHDRATGLELLDLPERLDTGRTG